MTKKIYLKIAAWVCVWFVGLNCLVACGEPKEVTNYSHPSFTVEHVTDNNTATCQSGSSDYGSYFADNDEPFNAGGEFVYNPIAFRRGERELYLNSPVVVAVATQILLAVDDAADQMILQLDEEIDEDIFFESYELAARTNPLVYIADFETNDNKQYFISYTDYFSMMNDNGIMGDKLAEHDFASEIKEFRSFVSNAINDNVSAYDSKMEQARKIYKFMLEHFAVIDDNEFYLYTPSYDPAELSHRITFMSDVLYHYSKGELYPHEFMQLYRFFLTQLNIDSICQLASGSCIKEEYIEMIPEDCHIPHDELIVCVISSDNNQYICNFYYDYLECKRMIEKGIDYECNCRYFGLSYDTFKKTFASTGLSYPLDLEAGWNDPNPVCEADYVRPDEGGNDDE